MDDCEKYQALISRLMDDDLDNSEKAVLAAHLRSCEQCRALYRAFLAVSKALPDDSISPPDGFAENVMAGVRRSSIRKRNIAAVKKVLDAAACLVLVAAVGIRLIPKAGSSAPESPAMAAPAAAFTAEDAAPAEKAEAPRMMFAAKAESMPAAAPKAAEEEVAEEPMPMPEEAAGVCNEVCASSNDLAQADELYLSPEAFNEILSSSTPCDYPESSVIDRQLYISSEQDSFVILVCGDDLYADLGDECCFVAYSLDELLSMAD